MTSKDRSYPKVCSSIIGKSTLPLSMSFNGEYKKEEVKIKLIVAFDKIV